MLLTMAGAGMDDEASDSFTEERDEEKVSATNWDETRY